MVLCKNCKLIDLTYKGALSRVPFSIADKEGDAMRIRDHLSEQQKKQLNQKKKKENLSDKDLKELMGINRDTYKRGKGGAIRRK